jgi:hypothetical protein
VYPEQFAGHFWNNVRFCRINLHQLIHQQCSVLLSLNVSSQTTNLHLQRSASESLTILLAEEVCATVPQLLSYSDYLDQFVNFTESNLPIRIEHPDYNRRPTIPGRSEHSKESVEYFGSDVSTRKDSTSPSSISGQSHSSPASDESAPKEIPTELPTFTPGVLDLASAFRLLMGLYDLRRIPWLPLTMKSWICDRISWIEHNSDSDSAGRLKRMANRRPADGFPVSDAPGQIPHGSICEAIALTPADQRLWFLAHSWLFVGIDWNADCQSQVQSSMMDIIKDPWQETG